MRVGDHVIYKPSGETVVIISLFWCQTNPTVFELWTISAKNGGNFYIPAIDLMESTLPIQNTDFQVQTGV